MIVDEEKILFNKIIEHLKHKKDMKDDLNGLTLTIYETEMSKLSERFMKTLALLIEKGIIKSQDRNGKTYYQLIGDTKPIKMLKKKIE